jgi:hypothetical protein
MATQNNDFVDEFMPGAWPRSTSANGIQVGHKSERQPGDEEIGTAMRASTGGIR